MPYLQNMYVKYLVTYRGIAGFYRTGLSRAHRYVFGESAISSGSTPIPFELFTGIFLSPIISLLSGLDTISVTIPTVDDSLRMGPS